MSPWIIPIILLDPRVIFGIQQEAWEKGRFFTVRASWLALFLSIAIYGAIGYFLYRIVSHLHWS